MVLFLDSSFFCFFRFFFLHKHLALVYYAYLCCINYLFFAQKRCVRGEGESRLGGGFLHLLLFDYGETNGGGETIPKL